VAARVTKAPPGRAHLAVYTACAVCVFITSGLVANRLWSSGIQVSDIPNYQQFGDAMARGRLPYRDFDVEYPPGALPFFLVPSLGNEGDQSAFSHRFERIVVLLGALALGALALCLYALRLSTPRAILALGLFAVSPLVLGRLVLLRFDLAPVALCTAAVAALLLGRLRIGFAALALGTVTKVYPALLLPLAIVYGWRRFGPRQTLAALLVFSLIVAVVVLPFALLAPGGVWDGFYRQASRPLQIESLGASTLVALHHLVGLDLVSAYSSASGSQNLIGSLPDAVAAGSSIAVAAALATTVLGIARGPVDGQRLVHACAAVVVAFVVLGKVLSPQFLLWLLPLVPLIAGRRGLAATGLLVAALGLTRAYFPKRYYDYEELAVAPSWIVAGRNLALVALLVTVAWPLVRSAFGRSEAQHAVARGTAGD
jgi:hypothetical protein